MTIITIRGTSGSGKSTLARRIMDAYAVKVPRHVERRKQPQGYDLFHTPGDHDAHRADGVMSHAPLRVLGHYESPTGGGDTLSDGLDFIDGLARAAIGDGFDVLYEGLVVSSDFKRIVALKDEGHDAHAIVLNTPLDLCIASVEERRRARGNDKPLNPKATIDKHKLVTNMVGRWRAVGMNVHYVSRDEAWYVARDLLKLEG